MTKLMLPVSNPQGTDEQMLDALRREAFDYFRKEFNPENGLVADKTQPGSPASIAAVGMGLSVYLVAIERGWMSRTAAAGRILTLLRFFRTSHQGPEADATGNKGFYYHFLDMRTGCRAWQCELSTIDTAIFIAGALTAATYFDGTNSEESEIRELAEILYLRIDWRWALNGGKTICHGWKSESGFLPYRWSTGYSEGLILYMLALGSPTFPIDAAGYREWTSTFRPTRLYEIDYLYAGPLFIHQMSHLWVDFRGVQDDFNRMTGIDYFENSRRATYVQREYAIENPNRFSHYHQYNWGFTASDGPGPAVCKVDGVRRVFFDYEARGVPFGPDDGTISPWAVVASLPFAPEIVIDTVRHAIERLELKGYSPYGFDASFNPTYPGKSRNRHGWVSPWIFGLNQGPIVLMIENYQTELIWKITRKCAYLAEGLRRAGFRGGWLEQ
ncbi:MAG TPA: glucoamylase family protein [Bryobacteraceae bacterium]|nr:glucoamylase family protein [Bryobacteraceae bacterium]